MSDGWAVLIHIYDEMNAGDIYIKDRDGKGNSTQTE